MEKRSNVPFGSITLKGDRPFFIAEAGVNYENDLATALKMIEEAAKAGADAIKFQSYKAGKLASRYSPSYWDTAKEPTKNQFELFQKYDSFNDKEFIALAEKAIDCNILFLSTAFDEHYADVLEPYMPAYKIASADLTHIPLLRHCAQKGKPMILSVGASTLGEIEEAISTIRNAGNESPIALLQCVLSYPCAPEHANLKVIEYLTKAFPECIIGYSDHVPPVQGGTVLTTAWLLGARILEKHFTLDKTKLGNDHYHAMDPDDISVFWKEFEFVSSLLGDGGGKTVLTCEENARRQARRSLVASRSIKAGEIISESDIAIKRPGIGIAPRYISQIIGARVCCDIDEDQILQWSMLLSRVN